LTLSDDDVTNSLAAGPRALPAPIRRYLARSKSSAPVAPQAALREKS